MENTLTLCPLNHHHSIATALQRYLVQRKIPNFDELLFMNKSELESENVHIHVTCLY